MNNKLIPIGLVATMLISGGVLLNKVDNTIKDVEDIDNGLKETAEKLTENDRIDLRQSILIENIGKLLNKLDEKLDRDAVPTIVN